MPALSYRANLSNKVFPFISEYQGRTVIVGGPDQARSSSLDTSTTNVIPELYYCHNVVPISEGWQSIDYVNKCAIYVPFSGDTIANPAPHTPFVYSWNDLGNIFDVAVAGATRLGRIRGDVVWTALGSLDGTAAWPDQNRPYYTKATINGVTYGLESQPGVNSFRYKNSYAGGVFFNTTYVFTGAPAAALIRGIAAVAGYGILWTEQGIFNSSSIDPLDYTPSLVTGAGGGSLQQAKGIICFVAPASFGAIIYCVGNAIAMLYTGNPTYPFTYQEIKGAGGYVSDQLIASDANSIVQFAYTTYGLQSLSATQAQGALTEITDFLSARYFEDFNESTFVFTQTALSAPVAKKFTLISGRFLIVSYGIQIASPAVQYYTHALLYDIELKRYGKFKIDHVDVYQWASVTDPTIEQIIGSIAFCGVGGRVDVPRLYHAASTSGGVFLLGKYQYVRVRNLVIDKVWIENINAAQSLRVSTLYALDGKNTSEQVGTLYDSTGTQRQYLFDVVGMNHSLLIIGAVDLSSLVIDMHTHGRT